MESALDLLVLVLQISWIIAHPTKPALSNLFQPQIKSHEPDAIDKQVNDYLMPIMSTHLGVPTPVPHSTMRSKDLNQISDLSEFIKLLPPSILTKKIKFGGKGKKLLEITAMRPKSRSTSKAPVAILLATNPNKDNVKFIDSVVKEKDEHGSYQELRANTSFIKEVGETKAVEEPTESELSANANDNTQKKLLEFLTDSELQNVFNVVLDESDWNERNKSLGLSKLKYSTESQEHISNNDAKKKDTIEKQDIIENQNSTEHSEGKKTNELFEAEISENSNIIIDEDIKKDFSKSDEDSSENLKKGDNDVESVNKDKFNTSEEMTVEKGEYEDHETKIHEESEHAIHSYHNNENKASSFDIQKIRSDGHDSDEIDAEIDENHDFRLKNDSGDNHYSRDHELYHHGPPNMEEHEVKIKADHENMTKFYDINEHRHLDHEEDKIEEENHDNGDDIVSDVKEDQAINIIRQDQQVKSDENNKDEGRNDQKQIQEERGLDSHDHHSRFHYAYDHGAKIDHTLTEETLGEIRQQSANVENNQEIHLSDDTVARLQIALTKAENAENRLGDGSTASNECSTTGLSRSANPSEFTKKSVSANSNSKSYNLSFLFNK